VFGCARCQGNEMRSRVLRVEKCVKLSHIDIFLYIFCTLLVFVRAAVTGACSA